MAAYEFIDHTYDVVVVGAGGSGLRATLGMAEQGLKTACVTKVFPTRSPHRRRAGRHRRLASATWAPTTGSGTCTTPSRGRTGSATPTRWSTSCARRRRRSTSSSTTACRSPAPRTAASTSARSAATPPSSARARRCSAPAPPPTAPATRSCTRSTASRLKHNAQFFIEYFAIDLIMAEDGACQGVLAWKLDDGTLHRFNAKMTVLATGGYGRAYFSATSAHTCTGDGGGMVARQGLPLQDMEFVQFHPTGIYGAGLPDHRGRPRRGRLSDQLRGRALHGALCADLQGSRQPRRGLALHDHRDPRGQRRRPEQGPHPPQPQPPAARGAARAPARHLRVRRRSSPAST